MGILLLLPFFIIRFSVLSRLNKDAVKRAAYFAPLLGREQIPYWIYQISNAAIILCICFFKIKQTPTGLFLTGFILYAAGLILLAVSVVNFAAPSKSGINQKGLYQLSRNPMYVAYFVFFIGCVLLMQSLVLFAFVLLFQVSAHWIILSEERWCIKTFGAEYLQYMKQVRRYL